MTRQRYREEFEQLDPEKSFEEEIARQHLAFARDANEIARSASYAASDAAAAAQLQARIRKSNRNRRNCATVAALS